jgi:hypothetical protein
MICGNIGQGRRPLFDLDNLRDKSTLIQHNVKHLHIYQINGQIRFGEAEQSRSESKQE